MEFIINLPYDIRYCILGVYKEYLKCKKYRNIFFKSVSDKNMFISYKIQELKTYKSLYESSSKQDLFLYIIINNDYVDVHESTSDILIDRLYLVHLQFYRLFTGG